MPRMASLTSTIVRLHGGDEKKGLTARREAGQKMRNRWKRHNARESVKMIIDRSDIVSRARWLASNSLTPVANTNRPTCSGGSEKKLER